MRLLDSLVLLLSLALGLGGNNTSISPRPVAKEAAKTASSFVSVDSSGSFTVDGSPFRFIGTNNYYLHYKDKAMIDSVLNSAQDAGFDVIRCWGFFDGVGNDYKNNKAFMQPLPNSYSSIAGGDSYVNCWERLDYAVSEASKKGLKLIIAFTNYWTDFGGIKEYVQWSDKKAGVDIYAKDYSADLSKFYTDNYCKTLFKNYIEHFVSRTNTVSGVAYKDDPTIFAWELMNEPRNPGKDPSVLTSWANEMTTYTKSVDTNHMVAVGDEGYFTNMEGEAYESLSKTSYDGSQGVDWKALVALENVDFGTYHLYPEGWGATDDAEAWGEKWIVDHIDAATALKKPCLCEEFGINAQNGRNREFIYSKWCETIYNEGGAGGLFWMLAGIDTGSSSDKGYYPDYDGYRLLWKGEKESVPEIIALKNYATLFYYGPSFVSFPDKVFLTSPYRSSSDYDDLGPVVIDGDENPTYRIKSFVRSSKKVSKVVLLVSSVRYGEMLYDEKGSFYYFDLEFKYFMRGLPISLVVEATLEDGSTLDSEMGFLERLLKYRFDAADYFDFAKEGTATMKSYGTCNASMSEVALSSWNGGAVKVSCKSEANQYWSELKIGFYDLGDVIKNNNKMTYEAYFERDLCTPYDGVIPAGAEATETSYGFRNYAALDPGWTKLCLNKNNVKAESLETVTVDGKELYKQVVSIPYSANSNQTLMVLGLVFNYLGYEGDCYIDNVSFFKRVDIGSPTDDYEGDDPNLNKGSSNSSSSGGSSSNNNVVWIAVGSSVGGVLLIGAIIAVIKKLRKKKRP